MRSLVSNMCFLLLLFEHASVTYTRSRVKTVAIFLSIAWNNCHCLHNFILNTRRYLTPINYLYHQLMLKMSQPDNIFKNLYVITIKINHIMFDKLIFFSYKTVYYIYLIASAPKCLQLIDK